jgi:predicted TPR repeat methyltransferase
MNPPEIHHALRHAEARMRVRGAGDVEPDDRVARPPRVALVVQAEKPRTAPRVYVGQVWQTPSASRK